MYRENIPKSHAQKWDYPCSSEVPTSESRTRLSDFTFSFHFHALEKEMATHSSVLAWRIPGTAEPGGLLSMGSHRVGHDWSGLAAIAAASLHPNGAGGGPGMKAITWALAGMGEAPRMGPRVPAVVRLFPPPGLEGRGASGVIWV